MLKLKNIKFAYMAGGKIFSVTTDKSVENKRVSLDITNEDCILSASIKTVTPIKLLRLSAEFEYEFRSITRIFLNGYQSWTDSIEHTPNGRMHGIDMIPKPISDKFAFSQYGDYNFTLYSMKKGCMHGYSYGYIRNYENYDFIGSLNENTGFTCIRVNCPESKVICFKECKDLEVAESYEGLRLYTGSGTEDEVFDRYFELMDIKPRSTGSVFGYTSWYRHYKDITQEKIYTDLAAFCESSQKADVFQIDDGYQAAVGDWLNIDENKFPDGLNAVADKIRSENITAGLWLAPFACEKDSQLFKQHPDWLVKTDDGRPVSCGSNWSGAYALDIYNSEFREYLKTVFDTVTNEWGFCLLKLDFLYAACIMPRKDKTRGMIMADAMDLLLELSGNAKILACGVPLASAFGKVDYCRIGCDVSLDWDDKPYMRFMHRERVSTRNSILNSVFRRHLNGRAFINDPDVFILREDDTTLTEDQKKCLAEINALCGGVLFTSDDLSKYTDERKQQLKEILNLREAQIVFSEISGGQLVLRIEKDGEKLIKCYDL